MRLRNHLSCPTSPANMSTAQLRAFHFVARYGGFSSAAREMAISQSTLSGQVKSLEATCGINLFERRRQGVRLSAHGEALYEITSRLFQAEAEARSFLGRRREADTAGHVRVAADGVSMAMSVLMGLRRQRPNLTFSLTVENSDRVTQQILDHEVDVGITAQPPTDARLHGDYLVSLAVGIYVGRDHPFARRSSVTLKDLEGVPFVVRERGSRTRQVFEQNLADAEISIGPTIEISGREAGREAVANGLGCGIVADTEQVADPRIVYLPIDDAGTVIDEYVVCMAEKRHLPLVAAFLREARRNAALDRPFKSVEAPSPFAAPASFRLANDAELG